MISNVSLRSVRCFLPETARLIFDVIFLFLDRFHDFQLHLWKMCERLNSLVNLYFLRGLLSKDSPMLFLNVVVRISTRKVKHFSWLFSHSLGEVRVSQSSIRFQIKRVPRLCCQRLKFILFYFYKFRALHF